MRFKIQRLENRIVLDGELPVAVLEGVDLSEEELLDTEFSEDEELFIKEGDMSQEEYQFLDRLDKLKEKNK